MKIKEFSALRFYGKSVCRNCEILLLLIFFAKIAWNQCSFLFCKTIFTIVFSYRSVEKWIIYFYQMNISSNQLFTHWYFHEILAKMREGKLLKFPHHSVEKRKIHCHTYYFSSNHFRVKFFSKTLIWRKICEKTVALKFRNFHTVLHGFLCEKIAWNQRIHCFFKEFFFSFSWSKNKFFAFSHCAKRKLYILWKLRKFTLIFFSNFWIKKLLNSWFDEYFLGESKFFIFSHCDRVLTNFAFSNHFSFF